ncbi:ankyrin repeat domain-containing protein [Mucilaginibacter lacusdianchii]|uniref:ankyrin repeat domain-containing protein n=1 Tax=Mucilaginibacter lacusdianchii TaxID=2684211 RepID=UPI00131E9338|nr:ankyrin repeat domain-containing protein [Mucilaginibacter sp. JXJ CY 39]
MLNLLELISTANDQEIRDTLFRNPGLTNEGISLCGNSDAKKGHPLHRVCDAVFAGNITDERAIEIAKILLEFGANIDGNKASGDNNTPLIAAASLHAEQLGIFYIEQGADVFYADNEGATALHWAAFCGRDKLVGKLIANDADINLQDRNFQSTPIGWALHTLSSEDTDNLHNQLACMKLLLKAGANQTILDADSKKHLRRIAQNDLELEGLLLD